MYCTGTAKWQKKSYLNHRGYKKLNFPDNFEGTVTNFDRHVLKGIFSEVQTLYTEQNPQGVHSIVKNMGGLTQKLGV